MSELGAGVVDGTVRVTVTAGNGDQSVYKLVFSTEKSDLSTLAGITIGGVALPGFAPDVTSYTYQLPVGTTELPAIVPILGDQYQTYSITTAGLNGKWRRIRNFAAFGITLDSLSVAGFEINFDPEVNEYWVNLPQETTVLPAVSYTLKDPTFQTASVRPISGLTGDYKITVRPQSGASRTYIIHFSVATSSNVNLNNIYVDGVALTGFQPDTTAYVITLPEGVSTIPTVTFEKAETSQRVLSVLEGKDVDEARVITECAVFADRVAVDEETVRLRSHIAQMRQMLAAGSPFGRKADFLIQEFNRESNTIGSKCQNADIAKVVVDLKSEIEKIREQIQNIE